MPCRTDACLSVLQRQPTTPEVNSGSPVFNAKGELIGTGFDRNYEGLTGDIAYNPQLQRAAVVDIRYTLFIIDKYAGAGHLIKEMTIIR